jgi:hypothetical protein
LLGEVRGLDLDLGQQLVDRPRTLEQQLEGPDPDRVAEIAKELGFGFVEWLTHPADHFMTCVILQLLKL